MDHVVHRDGSVHAFRCSTWFTLLLLSDDLVKCKASLQDVFGEIRYCWSRFRIQDEAWT